MSLFQILLFISFFLTATTAITNSQSSSGLAAATAPTSTTPTTTTTQVGYYSKTCPLAELIVRDTVTAHFSSNPTVAPGLLRLHFHDCFVRGCDASVLLEGSKTEREFIANKGLHGFNVIDEAKTLLEHLCPGVVSCADILALAARDSVVLAKGPYWQVPTGRRDGIVSSEEEAKASLPSFTEAVDEIVAKFVSHGLNIKDMVVLSGAHTIGKANCQFFSYRLYDFKNTSHPDPTIDSRFVRHLRSRCPQQAINTTTKPRRVNLDLQTPHRFDTKYFEVLKSGRGLLESDQKLWTHQSTKALVQSFMAENKLFRSEFAKSMVRMGNIGTISAPAGEVRKVCTKIN